ncbi:MAG: RsmE family RNA methyltransferase [Planctomycetota bacterium]
MPALTLSDPEAPETSPIDPDPPKLGSSPAKDAGPRFYCDPIPAQPGSAVTLDKDQARHATRVLRLSEGDALQLIDGRGTVAHATLTTADAQASCTIQRVEQVSARSPRIELATAIPKGPRADSMVNDLAQLGADVLIPLMSERSVVHPRDNKLQRFRKAAAEAGKQSGNAWFMRVNEPVAFADALVSETGLKLIADPYAEPIADLAQRLDSVSSVRVLIGPEGGLTDQELADAHDAGFIPWRFSPNTLRIETAAVTAVAILRSQA